MLNANSIIPGPLKDVIISYLPWVISSITAVVVATAAVIQTLNSLVIATVKARADLLESNLIQARADLVSCREEVAKERNRPMYENHASQPVETPTSTVRPRTIRTLILAAGILGVCLTIASVPLSSSFRATLENYWSTFKQAKQLKTEADTLAAPFTPRQVLEILESQPRISKDSLDLDGQSYDLDHLGNKRFNYFGTKPALLTASSTKGLLITSISGTKFELILKPHVSDTGRSATNRR